MSYPVTLTTTPSSLMFHSVQMHYSSFQPSSQLDLLSALRITGLTLPPWETLSPQMLTVLLFRSPLVHCFPLGLHTRSQPSVVPPLLPRAVIHFLMMLWSIENCVNGRSHVKL